MYLKIPMKAKKQSKKAMSIYGFTTTEDIATENVLKSPVKATNVNKSTRLSKTMISFENLVRIFPEGLESKKRTLDLITLSAIFL